MRCPGIGRSRSWSTSDAPATTSMGSSQSNSLRTSIFTTTARGRGFHTLVLSPSAPSLLRSTHALTTFHELPRGEIEDLHVLCLRLEVTRPHGITAQDRVGLLINPHHRPAVPVTGFRPCAHAILILAVSRRQQHWLTSSTTVKLSRYPRHNILTACTTIHLLPLRSQPMTYPTPVASCPRPAQTWPRLPPADQTSCSSSRRVPRALEKTPRCPRQKQNAPNYGTGSGYCARISNPRQKLSHGHAGGDRYLGAPALLVSHAPKHDLTPYV